MNDNINVDVNSKYNYNRSKLYIFIAVIAFVSTIVGATYAYVTLSVNVVNGGIDGVTTCFDIDYNNDSEAAADITGMMFPSSNASGGLSGKVSIKINNNCDVNGLGTLTLNVNANNDDTLKLIGTVAGHCEDSQTLKTMISYKTSSDCTAQTNGKWVTDGSALKYAVYNTNSVNSSTIPLTVGYINKTGSIKIYDNIQLTKDVATYYVYVWLDGNISDNSYADLSFDSNISASATQTETYN